VRAGLGRLEAAGEIIRSRSRIDFTLAGRAKAAPPAPELPWDALDVASAQLFPQWHAAFARLLADAVFSELNFQRVVQRLSGRRCGASCICMR
jgi:hypothetical protein